MKRSTVVIEAVAGLAAVSMMCVAAYRATTLADVIHNGDTLGARLRLALGDDVNGLDADGATPLSPPRRPMRGRRRWWNFLLSAAPT